MNLFKVKPIVPRLLPKAAKKVVNWNRIQSS